MAFANPEWTPASGARHPPRPPASLISSPQDLQRVVATVHYACDTLTSLARTSRYQIRGGARGSRILVPTRALPGSIDIPYAFWPTPEPRVASVVSRYDDVATASRQAAARIAVAAEAVRAPSQVLSAARDAVRSGAGARPRRGLEASPVRDASDLARNLAGPVENVLHQLCISDRDFLERSSTLDRDARRLIIGAAEGLDPSQAGPEVIALSRSLDAAPFVNYARAAGDGRALSALRPPDQEREVWPEAAP